MAKTTRNLNEETSEKESINDEEAQMREVKPEQKVMTQVAQVVDSGECYITTKESFHTFIGPNYYVFEKGKRVKVPTNVRDILHRRGVIERIG